MVDSGKDYFLELAKIGYQAYGDKAEWKNYQGNPMPTWDALPENIKTYWVAAAQAIKNELIEEYNDE
jgi:hypothetical protein